MEIQLWRSNEYNDEGDLLRIDYLFHLKDIPTGKTVVLLLDDLADLLKVLPDAVRYVKDHTNEVIRERIVHLFGAAQDARSSC